MTNTQTAISAATVNKPKRYKTRLCGTFLNGGQAPGESNALRFLEINKQRLVDLLSGYSDITITFFGTLAQIDYRHARILACYIYSNWIFLEKKAVGENYNYVIPNDRNHYILSTLGKLLDEPISNHRELV